MGNRLAMTSSAHGTTTYSYDAGDRLLSFADPGGTTNLTWDDNGNMTDKGSATYTFDPLDRLIQVVDGTTTVGFAYDGDGVRLGKTVGGVTTAYVQDLAAPLPVVLTEVTGGDTSLYVYGNDLSTLEDSVGDAHFYHLDGLGSTRALSNVAGASTDTYSYDVFGEIRSKSGSSSQSYTYTAEQNDPELGLIFLRARYYDPQVGRFANLDPFGGNTVNSQSLNRYIYARNNSINLIDPEGFSPLENFNWWEFVNNNPDTIKEIAEISSLVPIAGSLLENTISGAAAQRTLEEFKWRQYAGIVGLVPIAGSIWEDNILYWKGYQTTEEFKQNQLFNIIAAPIEAVGLLKIPNAENASDIARGIEFLKKFSHYSYRAIERLFEKYPQSTNKDSRALYLRGGFGGGGGSSWGNPPSSSK